MEKHCFIHDIRSTLYVLNKMILPDPAIDLGKCRCHTFAFLLYIIQSHQPELLYCSYHMYFWDTIDREPKAL